eukprot:CAMPEP_0206447772 /NCGR_PEP_ID=MMETSP0324_2-20121206/17031_1 /ASSEMBLY_ACC=CAM_ASM_000836 /TAXON_ID=2866 /ORGANISM="Crypthecodinium cohnii, Strain Seligo" /LENGTH=45 /DNA_ID= /DNA_START= /DNA_END= /DNA_ORIENTATION=
MSTMQRLSSKIARRAAFRQQQQQLHAVGRSISTEAMKLNNPMTDV